PQVHHAPRQHGGGVAVCGTGAGQLLRGFRKPRALAFTGAKFKLDVLTFDITKVAHAFAEVIPERQIANDAEHRQRALRVRRERPRCGRTADERKELAPSYVEYEASPPGKPAPIPLSQLTASSACRRDGLDRPRRGSFILGVGGGVLFDQTYAQRGGATRLCAQRPQPLAVAQIVIANSQAEEFVSISSRSTASMRAAPMSLCVPFGPPMLSILSRSEFIVHVRVHSFCSRTSPDSLSIASI